MSTGSVGNNPTPPVGTAVQTPDAKSSPERPNLTITRVEQSDGTYLFQTSDGKTFSIDELLFYVQSKIAKYFQARLEEKNDKLKEQIKDHAALTDLLTQMQSGRPSGDGKTELPKEVVIWMQKKRFGAKTQ